jgi:glycosyltransferase involved in cell wall biosynthesis
MSTLPTFCSVIIPTIGRATLSRAIRSVLSQPLEPDYLEVIIVNDSGAPLPECDWQTDPRVRTVTTNRRERSVARNAGAALAKGQYLWFLDDDDWLLPDGLAQLKVLADQRDHPVWLYGGIRVVSDDSPDLGEANSGLHGNAFAQVMGGAWVPLQASIIRADAFFKVGGFDPFICGTEDLDLCRRVALHGDFASTPSTVACLFRGPNWQTTTDYERAADDTRRSRDRVLAEPGAFKRLRYSAKASPDSTYWLGRLARVYWSTVGLNLRQRRLFAAASRAIDGMSLVAAAGPRALSGRYWQGAVAHHVPGTLHFIVQAYEQRIRSAGV